MEQVRSSDLYDILQSTMSELSIHNPRSGLPDGSTQTQTPSTAIGAIVPNKLQKPSQQESQPQQRPLVQLRQLSPREVQFMNQQRVAPQILAQIRQNSTLPLPQGQNFNWLDLKQWAWANPQPSIPIATLIRFQAIVFTQIQRQKLATIARQPQQQSLCQLTLRDLQFMDQQQVPPPVLAQVRQNSAFWLPQGRDFNWLWLKQWAQANPEYGIPMATIIRFQAMVFAQTLQRKLAMIAQQHQQRPQLAQNGVYQSVLQKGNAIDTRDPQYEAQHTKWAEALRVKMAPTAKARCEAAQAWVLANFFKLRYKKDPSAANLQAVLAAEERAFLMEDEWLVQRLMQSSSSLPVLQPGELLPPALSRAEPRLSTIDPNFGCEQARETQHSCKGPQVCCAFDKRTRQYTKHKQHRIDSKW
jgi:hypothetical protein